MAYRHTETNKMKCRLKVGDEVVAIAGRDKGKTGEIMNVSCESRRVRLKVKGINMVKKHVKPNPNEGVEGGIVPQEAVIDVSNVKLLNSATGKGDKIAYKRNDDGKKVRVFKSTGELIDSDK
jgi:large subunit ribosomal protein L24